MKFNSKIAIAALGAAVMSAAPALANAEEVYFLVGAHHIYKIGPDQYAFEDQRRDIEQKYADAVADANNTYKEHLDGGADPAQEADQFNAYLAQLSDDRDQQLGALYANADDVRESHPELAIEGEGPYQVMAVHYHLVNEAMFYDDYVVYAPWRGYVVVGAPFGWTYGVVYAPAELHTCYVGWHEHYWVEGSPAFFGFVGVHGAVNIGITIAAGGHGYLAAGHPIGNFHPGGFGRPAGFAPARTSGAGYGRTRAGGYGAPRTGGYGAPKTGGYGAPKTGGYGAPKTGSYGASKTGGYGAGSSTSGYGHPSGTSTGSGLSHSSYAGFSTGKNPRGTSSSSPSKSSSAPKSSSSSSSGTTKKQ